MTDAGSDDVSAEWIRFIHLMARHDPNRLAIYLSGTPASRLHRPTHAATHESHLSFGK